MLQKSYDNSPTLYLIPTPIGNMEDMTIRSINTLKMVDIILAEDTRVARELLSHFDIKKKVFSNYKYNETSNYNKVLELLREGKNIGLISDRGTPAISDPGNMIASYIISQGFNVVALPGATAFVPALTMSGLDTTHFTFYGFLDSRENKQKSELKALLNVNGTLIFYESPHRLLTTLGNILEVFGDRKISISREITKKYEEVFRGKISEYLSEKKVLKGEFVIVVDGSNLKKDFSELSINEHLSFYLNQGIDIKEAMKTVAKERKFSKSDIYREYHK